MHASEKSVALPAGALADRLRLFVLLVLVIGLVGTGVELVLLEHFEDGLQFVPLGLIAASLALLGWQQLRPGRTALRLFRATMVVCVAAGALGTALHYRANVEFQLELDPEQSRSEIFWKAVHAKTPPALAPGVMAQLGLLGLIYGYRHPVGAGRNDGPS